MEEPFDESAVFVNVANEGQIEMNECVNNETLEVPPEPQNSERGHGTQRTLLSLSALLVYAIIQVFLYWTAPHDIYTSVDSSSRSSIGTLPNAGKVIHDLASLDVGMVAFLAPGCPHTDDLWSVWEELCEELHIPFVTVDCSVERDVCERYGIDNVPTIALMENGQIIPPLFHDPRTIANLVGFADGHLSRDKWKTLDSTPTIEPAYEPEARILGWCHGAFHFDDWLQDFPNATERELQVEPDIEPAPQPQMESLNATLIWGNAPDSVSCGDSESINSTFMEDLPFSAYIFPPALSMTDLFQRFMDKPEVIVKSNGLVVRKDASPMLWESPIKRSNKRFSKRKVIVYNTSSIVIQTRNVSKHSISISPFKNHRSTGVALPPFWKAAETDMRDGVAFLTQDNFYPYIYSHRHVFVNFLVMWCTWCPHPIPTWSSFARNVSALQVPIKVVALDCLKSMDFCRSQDIQKFPYHRWYDYGRPQEYQDEKSAEFFMKFATDKVRWTA